MLTYEYRLDRALPGRALQNFRTELLHGPTSVLAALTEGSSHSSVFCTMSQILVSALVFVLCCCITSHSKLSTLKYYKFSIS